MLRVVMLCLAHKIPDRLKQRLLPVGLDGRIHANAIKPTFASVAGTAVDVSKPSDSGKSLRDSAVPRLERLVLAGAADSGRLNAVL